MGVSAHWPQTVEVCTDCGGIVAAIRHGQHPTMRFDVVPSYWLEHQPPKGAVDLREAVRALGSAWRANDDEAASSALARLEDTVGLREQGDPTPAEDAVERSGTLMEIRYAGRAVYAFQEDAEWLAQRLADDEERRGVCFHYTCPDDECRQGLEPRESREEDPK